MTLYDDISAIITGRIAIFRDEADYIAELLEGCKGIHIEIGTLWGATAILAALAKKAGKVYTIDMMEGCYWEDGDPGADMLKPSYETIMENLQKFRVEKRVIVHKGKSDPFPFPELSPITALIDGAHEYEGCKRDWENMSKITRGIIMFHDYNTGRHPGVKRVVDEINDPDWKMTKVINTLAVFEKVK